MYDLIIIGGGASGLSAAITLASAQQKFEWAAKKKILILDNNKSDLRAAAFWNAPGVSMSKSGKELLSDLRIQLEHYSTVTSVQKSVNSLSKNDNNIFLVSAEDEQFESKAVIIATGMHKVSIDSKLIDVKTHLKIIKPGKVMIENNHGVVSDNLYVTGLAAGLQTMFAIASGDGVRIACSILEKWGGNYFVPHDVA